MNQCKSRMSEHFLSLWTAAVTSAGEPQEPGLGQATICSNFFSLGRGFDSQSYWDVGGSSRIPDAAAFGFRIKVDF